MSAQYDAIGKQYNRIKYTPLGEVEKTTVEHEIGSVTGLHVLDLACGAGFYTHLLRQWGAAHAIGVDISPKMIEVARETYASDKDMEFHVADCSSPDFSLGGVGNDTSGTQFDLIFAGWFFNYASDENSLKNMLENVRRHLKTEGRGRLVSITPNPEMDGSKPLLDHYGLEVLPIAKAEHAWNVRSTLTTPEVSFSMETYRIGKGLMERCASQAGLKNIRWAGPTFPDDERLASGFWDKYKASPLTKIFMATT